MRELNSFSITKTSLHILNLITLKTESFSIKKKETLFDCLKPSVTLENYITRMQHWIQYPEQELLAAMIYIDRIVRKHPWFFVTSKNIFSLLAMTMIVADKFWNDDYMSNSDYAIVVGLSDERFNDLEAFLLILLDFDLYIKPEYYEEYLNKMRAWKMKK